VSVRRAAAIRPQPQCRQAGDRPAEGGLRQLLRWPRGTWPAHRRSGGEIDLYTIARSRTRSRTPYRQCRQRRRGPAHASPPHARHLWALASCAVTTTLAFVLDGKLHPANVIMLYLVGVMLVAMRYGRAAGAGVGAVGAVLRFLLRRRAFRSRSATRSTC
jgi:two-component system sensor histidine kinase KdpD